MPAASVQVFLARVLVIAVALSSPVVFARGGGGHSGGHSGSHSGGHSGSHSGGSHTSSHNSGASHSHPGTQTASPMATSGQPAEPMLKALSETPTGELNAAQR